MKICLLIKGLGLGGAERHVVDCALHLKQHGHQVCVAYLLPHKNALHKELLDSSIPVCCLTNRFWWLTGLPSFVQLVRSFRPDVIHAHLPAAALIARFSKFFYRSRVICTEHNVYTRLNFLSRLLQKSTHWLDDFTISCSKAVAVSLPWDSHVIENGVEIPQLSEHVIHSGKLRQTLGLSNDDVVFICVANFLKKKNHLQLLQAFDKAFGSSNITNVYLVLVGQKGTEQHKVEALSERLKCQKQIYFWGADPEATRLLEEADVFCLASTFEGLPLALLEGMARGLPAVVTRAGGMPEAVIDGTNGFVVDANSPDDYAVALKNLYVNPMLRKKMGYESSRRAREFYSIEAMMNKIISCYSDIVR